MVSMKHSLLTNKHLVIIVDANERHQKEVSDYLLSFYEVSTYRDAAQAFTGMKAAIPALIITSEQVPPHGGLNFVKDVRNDPVLAGIPILYIIDKNDFRIARSVKYAGADAYLIKPYRRSALINTMSSLLNAQVENSWEQLPELQKAALKNTVNVFNSIADVISVGTPLPYEEISKACAPLVDSIRKNDFKGILNGVRNHDNYTYAHSMRVATLLSLFGSVAGLNQEEHVTLATGGLLHDVGKMLIPHNVLNKPGRLDESEFAIMKSHVTETVRYLKSCGDIPKPVITIAEQHHEKLDGTGYPYGLRAGELNELARMAAIVDVFSALTDRRVYKAPMPPEQALAIMTDEMGNHLDQHFLKLFKAMLLDAVGRVDGDDVPAVHNPGHQGCC